MGVPTSTLAGVFSCEDPNRSKNYVHMTAGVNPLLLLFNALLINTGRVILVGSYQIEYTQSPCLLVGIKTSAVKIASEYDYSWGLELDTAGVSYFLTKSWYVGIGAGVRILDEGVCKDRKCDSGSFFSYGWTRSIGWRHYTDSVLYWGILWDHYTPLGSHKRDTYNSDDDLADYDALVQQNTNMQTGFVLMLEIGIGI